MAKVPSLRHLSSGAHELPAPDRAVDWFILPMRELPPKRTTKFGAFSVKHFTPEGRDGMPNKECIPEAADGSQAPG